ncbi:MAG TPA: hypothetical protein DEB06_03500 [Phycisphaerales bacterium]|nr:hypothetical protein [Phycisphaerales bacterium]
MRVDDIKKAYGLRPFRAFVMRTADGREFRVEHPEFLAFAPDGREMTLYSAEPGGWVDHIDPMLVVSLGYSTGSSNGDSHPSPPAGGTNGKRKKK